MIDNLQKQQVSGVPSASLSNGTSNYIQQIKKKILTSTNKNQIKKNSNMIQLSRRQIEVFCAQIYIPFKSVAIALWARSLRHKIVPLGVKMGENKSARLPTVCVRAPKLKQRRRNYFRNLCQFSATSEPDRGD